VLYISFNGLAVSFSRYLIDIGNSYTLQISSFHNTHGVFKLKWLTSLMLTCVKLWKSHCTEARTELGSKRVDKGDGTYTATYTAANTTGTAKIVELTNEGGGSYKVKGLEPFMSYYYLLRYYSCLGPQN